MQGRNYTFLQLSTVFVLSVGMMNHVLVIPKILDVSGRDSWISILLTLILFIPVFLVIAYIIRKTGQRPITQWLTEHYGRWLSVLFSLIVVGVLISSIIVTTKDFTSWTNSSYMPQTPQSIIVLSFLAIALYTAMKGIHTLVIAAGFLLPIIVLLGEFVMVANFQFKDYSLLFPILENGAGILWNGVPYIGSGFIELIFIVLLQHRVSSQVKGWHLVVLGVVLAGLTIGPTMGAISSFGPFEAALQRNSAFEQWRLVKVGRYMENVDFLSIFQWVGGAFIRNAVAMYIIAELLPKIRKLSLIIVTTICAIIVLLPIGDIAFYDWSKLHYYPIVFICLMLTTFILFVLVVISRIKERSKHDR